MARDSNGYTKYTAYVIHNRDPILDFVLTIKDATHTRNAEIAKRAKGGISAGTVSRWNPKRKKPVMRPQFATVAACAGALGLKELPITSQGRQEMLKQFK